MNPALTAALLAAPPPAPLFDSEVLPWALALLLLLLSAFFAGMRAALVGPLRTRAVEAGSTPRRRRRLSRLMLRAESLATSAATFSIGSGLSFALLLLGLLAGSEPLDWGTLGLSFALSTPALLLAGELGPLLFTRRGGVGLLSRVLVPFWILQLPLEEFARIFGHLREAVARALGGEGQSRAAREQALGLREAIEDAVTAGELDDHELALIERAIEFREADAAEIMTPRTEIHGVVATSTLGEVIGTMVACGHSRLPVHRENLDVIVGTIVAQDVLGKLNDGASLEDGIEKLIRPPHFVPETKNAADLLEELQRAKLKMAIVLDEYGGTAGLVTVGDVAGEIVGEFSEVHDALEPEPVSWKEDGAANVDAGLRISEVNELLELGLSEDEDYETLAGFVLAEFGRFPKVGMSFLMDGIRYTVAEATDRRVTRVDVELPAALRSA